MPSRNEPAVWRKDDHLNQPDARRPAIFPGSGCPV